MSCKTCLRKIDSYFHDLAYPVTEGAGRFSEIVSSVVALVNRVMDAIPETISTVGKTFATIAGAASIISIVKHSIDLFKTYELGKRFWQCHIWQETASQITLIISKIFSAITFFHTLTASKITRLFATLAVVGNIFLTVSLVTDIWVQALAVHKAAQSTASKWKLFWTTVQQAKDPSQILSEKADFRIEQLKGKITATKRLDQREDLQRKMRVWKELKSNPENRKSYADAKVIHYEEQLRNQSINKAKAWLCIAADVAFLALVTFAFVASAPAAILTFSLASVAILANVIDFSNHFLGLFLKEKKLEAIDHMILADSSDDDSNGSIHAEHSSASEADSSDSSDLD